MQESTEFSAKIMLGLSEKIRVLLVDDDSDFLKITKQCLEMGQDLLVDTAISVDEALTKLEKEKYDVVVSDYQMPEKDGLEFLKDLRRRGDTIPFVMFTGKGREEVAIKALNLGANQYLNKIGETETVYAELAHSITEMAKVRKPEEALRESEEKLRAIVSSSPDATSVAELNGTILDCNQAFLRLHGYSSKDELIGKDGFEIICEKDRAKARAVVKQLVEQGHAEILRLRLMKKDGREFTGELSGSLIHDSFGRPTTIVVVTKDLTEYVEAEETIRESQQKFERLFRGNPEAAVYLSTDFHILDINPRFERLFGYSLAEIKGKHLDDVIVQKERLEEAGNLNQRALQGYVYHDTLRRRKDGRLIPVSISAAPIAVEDRLEGYVGMYKDISELRNTEEALKETMGKLATINEKLRVVGSLTRHDVQNKLTLVTGNAYLVKKKAISDPETLERLRGIEEACRQIVEIFDFARSYETLGEEEPRYVDVADAFDKAASQFGDLKGTSTDNECKGLIVLADSLLTRLFYNLIDNSLKYGEKLTYMRIRMEKGREELKLIYEDDGVGIPLAEKSKLFTKGYGKGTGLGLYLIKKIMEAYGWAIKETGEPGKGAQFTMTIPRTNHKSKENYRIT
ncbi:MAG: PAS domain S-box protein [Candidatus Bathyarchaeia archaeon]|jgi:PAS domain S-box-containing protein